MKQTSYSIDSPFGTIEFFLQRGRRRTIAIEVKPTQNVRVLAPQKVSVAFVKEFVSEKSNWIVKQKEKWEKQTFVKEQEYKDGAKISFFKQELTMKIQNAKKNKGLVINNELHVFCKDFQTKEQIQKVVQSWKKRETKKVFETIIADLLPKARELRIPEISQLTVRSMKSRWGTCTAKRRVTLNTELMRFPKEASLYVVAHELCHLREMNHGKRFYALLEKLLPNYKEYRKLLHATKPGI